MTIIRGWNPVVECWKKGEMEFFSKGEDWFIMRKRNEKYGQYEPSGTMLSQGNITWIFLNCISYLFNFLPDGESIPLTHNLTCIYWDKQLFFSMYTNNNNVIISISLLNNSSTNAIFQRLYTLFYKNHSDFPCCIFKLTCFLSPIILWNQTFNSGRISI